MTTWLSLGTDSDVGSIAARNSTPIVIRQRSTETSFKLFAKANWPPLRKEELQPCFAPVGPIAVVSEYLNDSGDDFDDLVVPDENPELACESRPRAKASANEEVKADLTLIVGDRHQADIVNLVLSAPLQASGDGDLELARQV